MDSVRLGIVGTGNMGGNHARQVLEGKVPGLTLSALCDINPKRFEAFVEHQLPTFTSAEALLTSGTVDAVMVATPHYAHTTIGIQVLEAGLHLLVEKPICVHKADCEKLIAAHTDPAVVFSAMFNQRTDPSYQWLRERIEGGELGPLQRINWIMTGWFRTESYYQSGDWRATWRGEGGGVLVNQCPHQLDLWQWLFGMPSSVRAFCKLGQFHDIEVEDNVTAYMEYKNGCTGVFITTTGEAPGANRLEVVGDLGTVVIEHGKVTWRKCETSVSEHSRTSSKGFEKPSTETVPVIIEGTGEQHTGIMKNFAAAILHGEPLLAPAVEGKASVELGNTMLYSAAINDTVQLPLDAAKYAELLESRIATSRYVKSADPAEVATDFSNSF